MVAGTFGRDVQQSPARAGWVSMGSEDKSFLVDSQELALVSGRCLGPHCLRDPTKRHRKPTGDGAPQSQAHIQPRVFPSTVRLNHRAHRDPPGLRVLLPGPRLWPWSLCPDTAVP